MKRALEVPAALDGQRLDRVAHLLFGVPWSKARGWISRGKLDVEGETVTDERRVVRAGQRLSVEEERPAKTSGRLFSPSALVFVDADVVVVEKPAGLSSVPYDDGEKDTLVDRVRAALSRDARHKGARVQGSLGVVHRLDKETSGLLVFARTLEAKRALAAQFREHAVHRRYVAIAHGDVAKGTCRSRLVADRGDGLRGSTEQRTAGLLAITHVRPLERLRGATLVECQLETGRTHQIRVHLAEAGHPLVGDRVYSRDLRRLGKELILAPRVMLHARELGFEHPRTGRFVEWESEPPEDFRAARASLVGGR